MLAGCIATSPRPTRNPLFARGKTEFVTVDADEPLNFFQLGYVGRDRGPECNLAIILCAFGADRGLLPDQAQPALGAGADLNAADRSGSPSPNETLHVDEDH